MFCGTQEGVYRVELYAAVRRSVYVEGWSERAAARRFGLARETVRTMLRYRLPPGYRRQKPIRCPKLEAFTGVIDQILRDDQHRPKKQRHTAKRICERLRAEHDFTGGYTIVKAYVREQKRGSAAQRRRVREGLSGGERRRRSAMGTTLRSTTSAACRVASSTTTPRWRWRGCSVTAPRQRTRVFSELQIALLVRRSLRAAREGQRQRQGGSSRRRRSSRA